MRSLPLLRSTRSGTVKNWRWRPVTRALDYSKYQRLDREWTEKSKDTADQKRTSWAMLPLQHRVSVIPHRRCSLEAAFWCLRYSEESEDWESSCDRTNIRLRLECSWSASRPYTHCRLLANPSLLQRLWARCPLAHKWYGVYIPFLNDNLAESRWEFDPTVFTNGDLEDRIAAMLTHASRHLKMLP